MNELDQKLSVLKQNFLQEFRKITEQRLKVQKETSEETNFVKVKSLTVKLEPSLGVKVTQSRGRADDLENKLQEMRIVFEDKVKAVNRMKAELNRRENVLISSIQQIEAYLRAVFYLKQNADDMLVPLRHAAEEQSGILRQLTQETNVWNRKKKSLLKAIAAFQPAKVCLEKIISDLSDYSRIHDLVDYYLVLQLLQEDLLLQESEYATAEKILATDKQLMSVPAVILSKKSDLQSELKNLRFEITQLEEQIDAALHDRVKDAAARYDMQRWIKKLYTASIEFWSPERKASSALNMLHGVRDFTSDALSIAERLKAELPKQI